MTDEQLLLRSILSDPADDLPRLVYADWLDEHDRPEHAEFVRVQCRIWEAGRHHCYATCRPPDFDGCPNKALRERERELFDRHKCEWFGGDRWAIYYLADEAEDAEGQYPDATKAIVSRGFVSAVSLTLGAFLGEPCRQCGGAGWLYWNVVGVESGRDPCVHCSGTGRTEGVAARLFAAHPVERVTLVDREPEESPSSWSWFRVGFPDDRATLPGPLFELAGDFDPSLLGQRYSYQSREAALSALSDAAVAYGRERANLTNGGER